MKRLLGAFSLVLIAWSCDVEVDREVTQDGQSVTTPDEPQPFEDVGLRAIQAAVAGAERAEADRQRDAMRKPDQVLAFFGIEPGMIVLDMFSSGGYYTEILSTVVGVEGKVYAHNNKAYRDYSAQEIEKRYEGDRLANVTRLDVEVDVLDLPSKELDAVLLILSYHDLYYVVDDDSWPKIDGKAMLAALYDALIPGGVLGVVDHTAVPGNKVENATKLHRIEEAVVRREIEDAGFIFDAESDVLRNPDDVLSLPMHDESVRGRTDRFVYRFRKPDQ